MTALQLLQSGPFAIVAVEVFWKTDYCGKMSMCFSIADQAKADQKTDEYFETNSLLSVGSLVYALSKSSRLGVSKVRAAKKQVLLANSFYMHAGVWAEIYKLWWLDMQTQKKTLKIALFRL